MVRVTMFLGSLTPAFILLGVRNYADENLGFMGIFILLSALSIFCSVTTLKIAEGKTPMVKKITEFKDEGVQIPTFLITFIFPFMIMDFNPSSSTFYQQIIFVLILLLILIRIKFSYINPIFLILGYHVYDAKTSSNEGVLVVSKTIPRLNENLNFSKMTDNIYFHRGE